jgi:hypothetical protein
LNGTEGKLTEIQLYQKGNVDKFDWPKDCQYEKNYILPFIKNGSTKYIANVETEMALLRINEYLFPLTINNREYESSYVCSIYNACISYSKEEMIKLGSKPLELALKNIANITGLLLKSAQINKVVSINNWLLSTNLYQDWDGQNIKTMTDFLIEKFPSHAIISRSLNKQANLKLLKQYQENGYCLVPSRQVYLYDKKNNDYTKKQNTKWDFKLLKNTEYNLVSHEEITPKDYSRITELYNKLYLEKYSLNNPQFTEECIGLWHKNKLILMQGFRNRNGVLDGIIGFFERGGITTAPLVGYDTALPKSLGLYRMLIAFAIKHADSYQRVLNISSGASEFKRLRGAIPEIEFSVVYTKHLSRYRKSVWKILTWILTNFGIPLMRRYKL